MKIIRGTNEGQLRAALKPGESFRLVQVIPGTRGTTTGADPYTQGVTRGGKPPKLIAQVVPA